MKVIPETRRICTKFDIYSFIQIDILDQIDDSLKLY